MTNQEKEEKVLRLNNDYISDKIDYPTMIRGIKEIFAVNSSTEVSDPKYNPATIQKQREEFAEVVEPVMKWLAENKDPHASITITSTDAELKQGSQSHRTNIFIVD